MRRQTIQSIVFCLTALVAAARAENILPCPVNSPGTTLDSYLSSGYSCSVGNLVFSDFQYTLAETTGPDPADIELSPSAGMDSQMVIVPAASDGWSVPRRTSMESWSRYTVTVEPGSSTAIDGVLVSASIFTFQSASAVVTTYLCPGGGFTGNLPASCGSTALGRQLTSSGSFALDLVPDINTVGVLAYVQLTGGRGTSHVARLISLTHTFEEIPTTHSPEPGTLLTAGIGILLLAPAARRGRGRRGGAHR